MLPPDHRGTVLIVDDDPEVVATLARVLHGRAGFSVEGFDSSARAAQRLEGPAPALVITDQQMPGLSGLDVARRVRSRRATARVPVLLLSEHLDDPLRSEGLIAGVTTFARKPLRMEELVRLVDTLLAAAPLPQVR